jgi:hypothetical protein
MRCAGSGGGLADEEFSCMLHGGEKVRQKVFQKIVNDSEIGGIGGIPGNGPE